VCSDATLAEDTSDKQTSGRAICLEADPGDEIATERRGKT